VAQLVAVIGTWRWPGRAACGEKKQRGKPCGGAALTWAERSVCARHATQAERRRNTETMFAWWLVTHGHGGRAHELGLQPTVPRPGERPGPVPPPRQDVLCPAEARRNLGHVQSARNALATDRKAADAAAGVNAQRWAIEPEDAGGLTVTLASRQ